MTVGGPLFRNNGDRRIKNKLTVAVIVLALLAIVGGVWWFASSDKVDAPADGSPRTKVVINEAVRTLLYLPLYHAQHQGFFRDEGLDVEIVTGGTSTNSFAAMLSGEAQFSQADPMYVPISREKGSQTKVVAQVVARIAVWGLTTDPNIQEWSAESVRGKKISTHVRPMTAFTYAEKAVRDIGLDPDKDVEIIQTNPGTELIPLLNGQADFAFTLEPSVSTAVAQGARVILSFPEQLGDQVFTGLMTSEQFIKENRATVLAVVRAYERSFRDIKANPDAALKSAQAFFGQLDSAVLVSAVRRMTKEGVIPSTAIITEESWNKAIAVRVTAGDLKKASSLSDSCDLDIMKSVSP